MCLSLFSSFVLSLFRLLFLYFSIGCSLFRSLCVPSLLMILYFCNAFSLYVFFLSLVRPLCMYVFLSLFLFPLSSRVVLLSAFFTSLYKCVWIYTYLSFCLYVFLYFWFLYFLYFCNVFFSSVLGSFFRSLIRSFVSYVSLVLYFFISLVLSLVRSFFLYCMYLWIVLYLSSFFLSLVL